MADLPCKRKKGPALGRAAARVVVCAALAVCAWPFDGSAWLAGLAPSLSPFGALVSVAAGAGSLVLLGALAVAIASVFLPRVFCRWICPAGTCQDALTFRRKRRAWMGRVPQVGMWLLFIGTGAALTGYPLFGWLDPMVLFNAAFGAMRHPSGGWDWLAAAGFPLLLALALIAPGLWCGKLCPLGALQDLLRLAFRQMTKALAKPLVNQRLGTASPSSFGHNGGFFHGGRTWGEPQRGFVNTSTSWQTARGQEGAALSRRIFLGLGVGAGYRLVLPPMREEAVPVIRPPLAGKAARFTRLCVRCGACVRACPSGIIKFGGVGQGLASVLAPEVSFENDYCAASCTACGQACPTGAIPKFKAEDKIAAPMGLAQVDRETCLLSLGRECGACATACPHEALDLVWDRVKMVSRVVVKAKACTGCGYCEYVCVSSPRSIRVKACGEVRRA